MELVPRRVAPALEALVAASSSGEGLPLVTFELERSSGNVALELSVASVVSPTSENGVLVLLQDVSERERTAREKEALRAEVESSQRLASLGLLAAGVGHEINNPLTYVMGNVQYVLDRLLEERTAEDGSTDELVQLLRDAMEGANRIRSVVRDLRTFSRLESDEHAAVEIAEVVDSALSIVSNELRHRARVVKSYDAVDPVRGDPARLGQVFLNLLTNAAQAIRDGQAAANEVRVGIEKGTEGPSRRLHPRHGGGHSSRGDRENFRSVFHHQARRSGNRARPLHLPENRGGARRHDPRRESSRRGHDIPRDLADDSARRSSSPARLATTGEPGTERASILVVDDEPAVLRVVSLVLGDEHIGDGRALR